MSRIVRITEVRKRDMVSRLSVTYYEVEFLVAADNFKRLAQIASRWGRSDLFVKYHMLAKSRLEVQEFKSLNHTRLKISAEQLKCFLKNQMWPKIG